MNTIKELFGYEADDQTIDWAEVIGSQQCRYIGKICYKVRKSDAATAIGTCVVRYGAAETPIVICPARLLDRGQVFIDCLHLLTLHQPGNEIHVIPEVTVPGGSVDYVVASTRAFKVQDFVGIELQTLDTTGTIWPARQRLLRELGVPREDDDENIARNFGMNWKMTAKTTLMQMLHKVETFEHLNKKLVLVVQDVLLEYMSKTFNFGHLYGHGRIGDAMHIHAYSWVDHTSEASRLTLSQRLSTSAEGVGQSLGLQAEPKVELSQIVSVLESKLSSSSLLRIPENY